MLTKDQISNVARDTLRECGMHLIEELDKGEQWGGSNLVALLEVFADRLCAAGDNNYVGTIDSCMGAGWTRRLAEELGKGTP